MADSVRSYTRNLEQQVKERTAALTESETRTRAILNTAAEGIITIDEWGIINSFNAAAESIFGYQSDEVIGKNVSMLMPQDCASIHDNYIAHYLHTGQDFSDVLAITGELFSEG